MSASPPDDKLNVRQSGDYVKIFFIQNGHAPGRSWPDNEIKMKNIS
jgi:hypothetical protein